MAWIDDRAWCHPKLVGLSDRAFRVWVNSISYSAGMATKGVLSTAQQKLLGSSKKVAEELVKANVWTSVEADGSIRIKDWDEHNGKRDERRAADRERKRTARGLSAGTSAGQSAGRSTGTARVEGSEGSDRTTTGAAERLKAAGWSTTQLAEVDDFARAVAWLDHAKADPNCQSVGALSWSMFKKGGWPERAVTIANGAQGTRSVIPKPKFVCDCGVGFNSEPAYEDHLGNVHGVVRA